MERYYGRNGAEIIALLGTNINKGLLEYDCILRRETYGDNTIDLGKVDGRVEIVKDLVKRKYIYVSILISIVFILNKLNILALINFLILIFNISFKVYYEYKRQKDLDILQNLNKAEVIVLREGIQRIVEARELVKGDIVIIKKDSFICADLRIINSNGLKVNEQNVTGENLIKEKYESKIDVQASSLGEINNMLFRGSTVKAGIGMAIVVETGNNTQLGKLLSIINQKKYNKNTILKRSEDTILKLMLCLILVNLIMYLVLPGKFIGKQEIFMYGLFSIVTICIPVIIIFYCKEIKKIFMDDDIDIINFSSFDLVNDVKVIFINNNGSIIKDELYLGKIYTNEKVIDSREVDIKDINIKRILDISLLANYTKYNENNKLAKGDMYEIAYVKYCTEQGIFKSSIDNTNKRKFDIPKDTNKNLITTVNKGEKGYRANTRGALEGVLKLCTHILVNGIERELEPSDIEKIKLADLYFSRSGLVTEAFAYRSFTYEPSKLENIESNLVFVGLVALERIFVEGVTEDIEKLIKDGIVPIIITDDNKIVGEILGRKIGLISSSKEVISGVELESLSEKELYTVISRTRVFCRLTPELKTKVISIFNNDGFKVCVEGETLGELSVLNGAHLSIIKGKASALLRACGDLGIKENGLKAFLKIAKESKSVNISIKNAVKAYSTLVLSEIVVLNCYYDLAELRLFGVYTLVFMNFFLLTPVILLVMNCGRVELNKNKPYIRGIVFSFLPLISTISLSEFNEFAAYMILGGMIVSYAIVNSKLSFRSFNVGVKLLLITIFIYILGGILIGFMSSVVYSKNLALIIGGLILIYFIADLIITKWQDS